MKWKTYLDIAYGVLIGGAWITFTNINNDWFIVGCVICVSSAIPFLKSVHGFREERRVERRNPLNEEQTELEKGEKCA